MNRIRIPVNSRAALAALLTIILAGAAPTLAQRPDVPGDEPERMALEADADDDDAFGPGGGRRLERLARRLEMNEEQRTAIAAIREAGHSRDLPLRKQLRQLRHELQGEMMKDVPSGKTVTALARDMGDLRTKIQTDRLQDRLAVRALLTAEQRDKLDMMREHGRGRGFRHDGQHGGQRGGQRGGRGW